MAIVLLLTPDLRRLRVRRVPSNVTLAQHTRRAEKRIEHPSAHVWIVGALFEHVDRLGHGVSQREAQPRGPQGVAGQVSVTAAVVASG